MVIYLKKLRIIAIMLILILCVHCTAIAAPRIPVYKVGNVLFFLDKSSGTITGFAGDPKDLVIPTSLGGYAVVSIGTGAFSGSPTLETLVIPDGISTVSANAFASCPNLKSVEIGSSVSYIGSHAFSDCSNLTSVVFKGNPSVIEPDAFSNSSWINGASTEFVILGDTLLKYNGTEEKITVPDGVKSIASGAFAYNSLVKEIILPEGLEKIGDNAFVHCYSLVNLNIPATVSHIGAGAFDDTIWLHNKQGDFVVVNGILVSYKGSDSHVVLPEGITAIGAGAFMAAENLLSVRLPETVVYIDSMAFGGCTSLLKLNLPRSVEWIDEYAFASCAKLTLFGKIGSYGYDYAEYMEMPFSTEVLVSYNGENVNFSNAVPIIHNERTFLPLRALMEMMGYTVSWDSATGLVTCIKGSDTVTVSPEGVITVNSVVSPTVAPPINMRGTNLVSARVIAEAVDAQVNWNNDTRTVEITY